MHIKRWRMSRPLIRGKVRLSIAISHFVDSKQIEHLNHTLPNHLTYSWPPPRPNFSITVTVRFQPLPSAPHLKNRVFKISASQKFETVVKFLRKKLDCKETDSVFCYVNSVFAPGLDEGVGGLWRVSISVLEFWRYLYLAWKWEYFTRIETNSGWGSASKLMSS